MKTLCFDLNNPASYSFETLTNSTLFKKKKCYYTSFTSYLL